MNKTRKFAILFSPLNDFGRFNPASSYSYFPYVPYLRCGLHQLKIVSETPTFKQNKEQIDFEKMMKFRDVFIESRFCNPKSYDYSTSLFIDPSIQSLISNVIFFFNFFFILQQNFLTFCLTVKSP